MARAEKISQEGRKQRWKWTGHMLRKDKKSDLLWSSDEYLKKKRPPKKHLEANGVCRAECSLSGWNTWNSACYAAVDQTKWKKPHMSHGKERFE